MTLSVSLSPFALVAPKPSISRISFHAFGPCLRELLSFFGPTRRERDAGIVHYVTRSQILPGTRLVLSCIRYVMQGRDVFHVISEVFGITLANRGTFGMGI